MKKKYLNLDYNKFNKLLNLNLSKFDKNHFKKKFFKKNFKFRYLTTNEIDIFLNSYFIKLNNDSFSKSGEIKKNLGTRDGKKITLNIKKLKTRKI